MEQPGAMDYSIRSGRVKLLDYSMRAPNPPEKVKILDYYTMDILNEDGVTPANNEGRLRGSCNICGKSYSGTERVKSNFITHLRKNHPVQYNEFRIAQGKQNTLSISCLNDSSPSQVGLISSIPSTPQPLMLTTTTSTYTPTGGACHQTYYSNPKLAVMPERRMNTTSEKNSRGLAAISKLITDDLVSLEVVNSPRFKEVIRAYASIPQTVPTGKEVEDYIQQQANKLIENFIQETGDVDFMWISYNRWGSSVILTSHYITNWEYQHFVFALDRFDSVDEASQEILMWIKRECNALELGGKVQGLVGQLNAVISLVAGPFNTGCCVSAEDASYPQFTSFIAELGEGIYDILGKDNEYSNILVKAETCLKEMMMIHGQPTDSRNRQWYEELYCYKSLLVAAESKIEIEIKLSNDDRIQLQSILEILEPAMQIAARINAGVCVSSSLVIPSIRLVQTAYRELQQTHKNNILLTKLTELFEKLQQKYINDEMYQLSTMLDPRFKVRWCDENEREQMRKKLTRELQMLQADVERENEKGAIHGPVAGTGFFSKILKPEPQAASISSHMLEVYRYLDEPLLPEESNPLVFWEGYDTTSPKLAHLARKYLSMPVSKRVIDNIYHDNTNTVHNLGDTPLESKVLEKVMVVRSAK